jgi:membrane-bound lytic murein transglycosylase D
MSSAFAQKKRVETTPQVIAPTVVIYDTVRVTITDTVKVVVKEVEKVIEVEKSKPTPRIDTLTMAQTPAEIDSLMERWTKLNRALADKKYFERYTATAKEANMPKDSLYKKRLQDMVSPVQLPYNAIVRGYIDGYLSGMWSNMKETLAIAQLYFPILEEELIAAGLPIELRYLAVVESNLSILAGSHAGAMGLWQIMPSTGKSAGLEVNSLVDERCDIVKSTKAACSFLKYLYKIYGDWPLAIAAYNCGAGNVNRALESAGKGRKTYWDIYDYLPHETRHYVPKFIGAAYAFTYYKAHNIVPDKAPDYIVSDTVTIKRTLHLGQVASTLNIPIATLRALNPQYKLDIIPASRKSYALRLPMRYMSLFTQKEKEIYSKEKSYLKEYMNPANLDKKRAQDPNPAPKPKPKPAPPVPQSYTYTIKDGDMLGFIAIKNNCTVEELKKWNNLTSDAIRAGDTLLIKRPKPTTNTKKKPTTKK